MRSAPEYHATTLAVNVQQKEGVILYPSRNRGCLSRTFLLPLYGLGTQNQEVTHGQHVSLGGVLNLTRASIGTDQAERAFLFPLLQKGLPQL